MGVSKGTIHWVSAEYGKKATVRLYENLIDEELGVYNEDGSLNLNPNSLTVLENCVVEPSLMEANAYDSFQFVRQDSSVQIVKIQNQDNLCLIELFH